MDTIPNPGKEKTEAKETNANRNLEPIPTPIIGEEAQQTNQTEQNTEEGNYYAEPPLYKFNSRQFFMMRWIEQHSAFLEIILTAIAILVAGALFFETRRQVDEAHKQVLATYKQTATMRESVRKELKAYVNIVSLPKTDAAHQFISKYDQFLGTIKNFGQTPAYKVNVRIEMLIGENANPPTRDSIVFGKGGYPFTLDRDAQETIIGELITHGKQLSPNISQRIFIVGKIQYLDIFDDTTIVCFRYRYVAIHQRFFTDYNTVETRQTKNE